MKPEEPRVTLTGNQPPLILASASPRRKELLRSIGLSPRIMPSDTDETADPNLPPEQLAMQLAVRKAEQVADALRQAGERVGVVIGADTVVCIGGEVLGKPADAADAVRMLEKLQGKEHQVYTGVHACDVAGTRRMTDHRKTDVRMKPLTPGQIRRYVATGDAFDKAGAYAVQSKGALLVESIRGCYFNVVGLPLSLVADMLAEFGVDPLSDA